MSKRALPTLLLGAGLALSCQVDHDAPARSGAPGFEVPEGGLTSLSRLTRSQYEHAIRDIFGPEVIVPGVLEPDRPRNGGSISTALNVATSALSRRGVAQYEGAARGIAAQIFGDETADEWRACTSPGLADLTCARDTLRPIAERAWRRPVDDAEADSMAWIAVYAARVTGTFDEGLEYGLSFILQSPDFLYRPSIADETGRLDAFDLASRLSFFLWDTIPDEALFDAARSGALLEDDTLAAEVDRMLADPRAEDGLRSFVDDWLDLEPLDDLNKDTTVFLAARPALGPAMREETERFVIYHLRERHAPYPELFSARETFVDRTLAALYEVPAPSRDGFGMITLPEGERMGLLGQASILALWAHPTSSSPTLRGRFMRQTLLCQEIPPPPTMANTAVPEPSETARTLRERLAVHRNVSSCASCHALLDPIGLALERFDGIGHFRTLDNGAPIDPSGDLDGEPFADAAELSETLAGHDDLAPCFARHVFSYAVGREEDEHDIAVLRDLDLAFYEAGYDVEALRRAIALSISFRMVRPEEEH